MAERITKPWVFQSDGNLLQIVDDLLSQGMNPIHRLEPGSMDLDYLKQAHGDRCAFAGNIDIDPLGRGTPVEVRQLVKERIAQVGPGYGYLLCSSNSITDYCRPEDVVAVLDALHAFGCYALDLD